MDNSPKGRKIEWIDGNADDIVARGTEIEDLGQQMQVSAGLLRQIADGATGMKGLSVDKIREVTGEVYEELQLAGERYSPTGAALKEYGKVLGEVQTGLQAIIEACEASWKTYSATQGALFDAKNPSPFELPPATPEDETAAEEAVKDADTANTNAKDAFEDDGDDYDAKYDSWEEAFNIAVKAIGDATDGGIEDSWKDNMNGFLEVLLEVLSWVAIVLAVLCIVIGGPIFAALAAIVAIVTLIATVILFAQGKKDGWDLAWAIVGVIPFGKLTQIFKPGGAVNALKAVVAFDEFASLGTAFKAGWTTAPSLASAFGAGGKSLWGSIADDVTFGTADMLAPMFGGSTMADLTQMMSSPAGTVELIASHVLDWNIKTVVIPIANDAGPNIQGYQAEASSNNQADTWKEQLANS